MIKLILLEIIIAEAENFLTLSDVFQAVCFYNRFSYKKTRNQFTFIFTRTLFYYIDEIVMERCLFVLKQLERGATGFLERGAG